MSSLEVHTNVFTKVTYYFHITLILHTTLASFMITSYPTTHTPMHILPLYNDAPHQPCYCNHRDKDIIYLIKDNAIICSARPSMPQYNM